MMKNIKDNKFEKVLLRSTLVGTAVFLTACQPPGIVGSIVPAEEFARAASNGNIEDFSFKKAAAHAKAREDALGRTGGLNEFRTTDSYSGEKKLVDQGMFLKRSYSAPKTMETEAPAMRNSIDNRVTMGGGVESARGQLAGPGSAPSPLVMASAGGAPLASSAPYLQGQMNANPSLWPDRTEGVFLFNDHRAFNPMDILTIVVDDSTQGNKRGNTQTKTEFDLLAGITNFFGLETKSWASNNEALNPSALISASTDNEFKGQAQIQRQATLKAQVSAVVMEILPNGVMRIEGSKIVAINNEEEIMVISGLVRKRDIAADNQVDSNRIANMRIDFYGHGTLTESQSPGWATRVFNVVWPF